MENQVIKLLKDKNLILSVAESFTGGTIASKLVGVSGCSEVFFEGIVCYNSLSKQNRLNVKEETLLKFKAVSKEVASEMLDGLLATNNCDVAVATTGIAGPNSDDSLFPVGLCYVGVATKTKKVITKFNFNGNRQEIISQSTKKAFEMLINLINEI